MKTHALLMAAGESKRFNGVKQLATISGQSMINNCLNNYMLNKRLLPELERLIVVLGANSEAIQIQVNKQLASNITIFHAKEWQLGLGHSISAAIAHLNPDVTHVLISLADQIAIKTENFRLLLETSKRQPEKIISACYADKLAVPAIFPRKYFEALMALSGDTGAKKLLQLHGEQVISISMPQAEIDIDSKEDLSKWLQNSH